MSNQHAGNVENQVLLEEHDGILNAKRVSLVSAPTIFAVTNAANVANQTITPVGLVTLAPSPNFIGIVTVANPAAAGNVTLDPGSLTGMRGNLTLSDSKGFIGLVSLGGGPVNIVGNVTLSDPKGFIGLVTVVQSSAARTITGNMTLDVGSLVGIRGNLTLSDPKGFIGLVTVVQSSASRSIIGNVTLAANSGVDIGDVDVTSVIPGTGATNLGKAQDSAVGATDTGVANLIKRVDTPATVTPAASDYMLQLGDKYGNTFVVEGAYEVGTNFNAILNDVDISVKASAGYLKSIQVSNINAAIRYLQIHNKATAPASTEVPVLSFPIPAGTATVPATISFGREDWGDGGYYCSIGVAIGISTAAGTFTAATTTDHVVAGNYV